MKAKQQITELLTKAMELLKRQKLETDELKVRTYVTMAMNHLDGAEDDDAPKSQAV